MSYSRAKKQYEESRGAAVPEVRTDYRCAAHGCPNAASINGRECYHHHVASPESWHEVTRKIRADPSMRNWGDVPTEPSAAVKQMRARVKPGFHGNILVVTKGES
jgi:hypothetical protein